EAARSGGRGGGRHRLAGNRAGGRGTRTQVASRSAEGSRDRTLEGAGGMVGHHARRSQGLDPVDRVRQAGRDALEADRECLRYARQREATPLLLRSVWDVCVRHEGVAGSVLLFQYEEVTTPAVLPAVPYRGVRRRQRRGAKPSGQRILIRKDG